MHKKILGLTEKKKVKYLYENYLENYKEEVIQQKIEGYDFLEIRDIFEKEWRKLKKLPKNESEDYLMKLFYQETEISKSKKIIQFLRYLAYFDIKENFKHYIDFFYDGLCIDEDSNPITIDQFLTQQVLKMGICVDDIFISGIVNYLGVGINIWSLNNFNFDVNLIKHPPREAEISTETPISQENSNNDIFIEMFLRRTSGHYDIIYQTEI